MAAPQLIVFDCDGVLIDSEKLGFRALTESFSETYGVSLTVEEISERYVGRSEAVQIADLEARYGVKISSSYIERKHKYLARLYDESLEATPGILPLLASLQVKKCVASSSSLEGLRHSLGLVGLWDKFAPHIFSATQVEHGKPAPDLFLFAAGQMGAAPSSCLVIEDSVAGVQAAKAAGMRVYGFTGGSHCDAAHGKRLLQEGAEEVFAHMSDVGEALRGP